MADVVSKETRSRMMAGIRGKNTRPELMIRRALHARGFRYLLHDNRLAGKPDLVFPKYKAAIFVNGCFWHGHKCHLFKWPASNAPFWQTKISRNVSADQTNLGSVRASGWRVAVVWECALKGRSKLPFTIVVSTLERWLVSDETEIFIQGQS